MTVELEHRQLVCWRCGGTGNINHQTDRCPGCAGTGQQAHLRPVRAATSMRCAVLHLDHEGNVIPCLGYPHAPAADQPCPSCGGSGYRVYQREVPDGSGRIETVTDPCSGCGGRGRVG